MLNSRIPFRENNHFKKMEYLVLEIKLNIRNVNVST